MQTTTRFITLTLSLALLVSLGGCLKTRSQIKGNDDPESETPQQIENQKNAIHKTGRYEFEELKTEVTRLSGKLEEIEHKQTTANVSDLREYVTRIDARVAELEKNQILVLSELKNLKDKEAEPAREAARPSADLAAEAGKLLAERKFEEAADKYRALLAKNPKGPAAAEAHFGLGESEYGQKNYKKAIVQYSKVQEVAPKSPKVPTSLYRIALSFGKLNMPKEAKGFFAELIERFPKSAEAKKAKAKVKE